MLRTIVSSQARPSPPRNPAKMPDGEQVCVLNHVLRFGLVPHQPTREVMCRVQVR